LIFLVIKKENLVYDRKKLALTCSKTYGKAHEVV